MQTGATGFIEVVSGDVRLDVDAGAVRPATVEGIVWHDLNANGIREEGEPGIVGAVVALHNDDDEFVEMTTTGEDGSYAIGGLTPDTYYGKILPLGEFFLSPANQGNDEENDSDFDPTTSVNSPVKLTSGDTTSGKFDAGLWMFGSIGDFVWRDKNANGLQDEDPLLGYPFVCTINLYDSQGLVSTMETSDGVYSFEDLTPGTYEVEFITEELIEIFTTPFKGDNIELDSDVDPSTSKATVFLVSGEIRTDIDAGLIIEEPYYPDW